MGNTQGLFPPPDTRWIRTEPRGYFRTISWHICWFAMLCLFIFQLTKVYSDLFTKERKSVAHKKVKPEIGCLYKLVIISATITIFLFLVSSFTGFFSVWAVGCEVIFYFSLNTWELGKGFMYIVFVIRLHTSFKRSAYAYNKYCLIIFGSLIFMVTLVISILSMIYVKVNYFIRYKHLKHTCGALFPPLLTSSIAIFDFVICIVSVILFIYPLSRLISKLGENGKKSQVRLVKLGIKYFILTTFAVITTCIQLIFMSKLAETTLIAYDMVVNSICVMFMLPYYPDEIYYERYCCCFDIPLNKCIRKLSNFYDKTIKEMYGERIESGTGTSTTKSHQRAITLTANLSKSDENAAGNVPSMSPKSVTPKTPQMSNAYSFGSQQNLTSPKTTTPVLTNMESSDIPSD